MDGRKNYPTNSFLELLNGVCNTVESDSRNGHIQFFEWLLLASGLPQPFATKKYENIIESHYANLTNNLDIYTETIVSKADNLTQEHIDDLNRKRQEVMDKINSVKNLNLINLKENISEADMTRFETKEKTVNSEEEYISDDSYINYDQIIYKDGYVFEYVNDLSNCVRVVMYVKWHRYLDINFLHNIK